MQIVRSFLGNERGATSLEYAVIAALVSIVFIAGAKSIGTSLSSKWLGPLASGLN